MNEVAVTQSSLLFSFPFLSFLSPPLLTGTERESVQALNMVLCLHTYAGIC